MNLHRRLFVLFALIGSLAPACTSYAQEPSLLDVLNSTPDRANAILFVDVPGIKKLTEGSLLNQDLSNDLGEVRIASDLNLTTLEPAWEIGYVSVKGLVNAQALATKTNGYVDKVGNTPVVWTPRKSYLIPMPNNVLGLVRPSDRKLVGRWLKNEKATASADYLKKQATQGTKFLSMLIAIDLEDTFSPSTVEQRISNFTSLKGADLKSVASTLAGVKGIKAIVGKNNLTECIISIEFSSSPKELLPHATDLMVEVLQRNNTSIPEAKLWDPSVEGNTLSYKGVISVDTLDDMLGIFTLQQQATDLSSKQTAPIANPTSDSAKVDVAKAYFAKTSDLIKRVRDYSAKNTGDRAALNGRMARRIDEIPTLGVDPELVDYAARVAEGLRGNMVALQKTNIQAGATTLVNEVSGAYNAYGNNGYGYGYSSYNGYASDLNAPGVIGQARGNASYRELISSIDQMEADTRRRMTEKYSVQF